ncbi:MAG: hypothetical protein FWF12_00420 [Betaproteobacteria bacterium]|nr:hypothetical protein [Betaproteobacteria bacterium]
MEFIAGPNGNDEISQALGYEVMHLPDNKTYRTRVGHMAHRQPDYCADVVFCLNELKLRGVVPFVLPTEKAKRAKKFEPGFVALFEIDDELHMTEPQATEAAAAACVLWFVANSSKF